MQAFAAILLSSVTFLAWNCSALQCHTCQYLEGSSTNGPNCEANAKTIKLEECDGNQHASHGLPFPFNDTDQQVIVEASLYSVGQQIRSVCRKGEGKLHGKKYFVRGCWPISLFVSMDQINEKNCKRFLPAEYPGSGLTDVHMCFCDEDKCNGAFKIGITPIVFVLGAIVIFTQQYFV